MTGTKNDRIVAAAREWNEARKEARRLRDVRAAIYECDKVIWSIQKGESGVPCWKDWQNGVEEMEIAPLDEWCESCLAREAANMDYRIATKRRGIALRRLQALMAGA